MCVKPGVPEKEKGGTRSLYSHGYFTQLQIGFIYVVCPVLQLRVGLKAIWTRYARGGGGRYNRLRIYEEGLPAALVLEVILAWDTRGKEESTYIGINEYVQRVDGDGLEHYR